MGFLGHCQKYCSGDPQLPKWKYLCRFVYQKRVKKWEKFVKNLSVQLRLDEVGLPPWKLKSNILKSAWHFCLPSLLSPFGSPLGLGIFFLSVGQATVAFPGTLADLHVSRAFLSAINKHMHFLQLFSFAFFLYCGGLFPSFFYLLLSIFSQTFCSCVL